jgi:hypothetical protein
VSARGLRPLLGLALALAWAPEVARADDGAYGRFEGDLMLAAGAGAGLAPGGPTFAAGGRALFLSSAGPYLTYADSFGSEGPELARRLGLGVSLAPLFLARYAADAERGPAWLDLLVDSLALDAGVAWLTPAAGDFDDTPGLELGVSLALPLGSEASGFFVEPRLALLLSDAALGRDPRGPLPDALGALTVTLAYHAIVASHLVDAGDRRPD